MGCDLEVDTDAIRGAAALLGQAAQEIRGLPLAGPPPPLADHAAGSTAVAREASCSASTRAQQALEAAAALAAQAEELASALRQAADMFEAAEALCRAGR